MVAVPQSARDVIRALKEMRGDSVELLRNRHGILKDLNDKSYHVRAIREELADSPAAESAKTFVDGNSLKVVRLSAKGEPVEATSFVQVDLQAFLDEEWESSRIRQILSSLLVVGIRHADDDLKGADIDRCTILGGTWCPPHDDAMELIRSEWLEARELVRAGRIEDLRDESEARCIYVKRKGQGGKGDAVEAPGGSVAHKQSFWLTKRYVRELLSPTGWTQTDSGWPMSRPRIFVVPADPKNFELSVQASCSEGDIAELVGDPQSVRRAVARSLDQRVRTWGAKRGEENDETWKLVSPGDWVFFLWGGRYEWAARVTNRPATPQPSLARATWPGVPEADPSFDLVYFLDEPLPMGAQADALDHALGESRRKFREVPPALLAKLVEDFGSIEGWMAALFREAPTQQVASFSFWQSPEASSPFNDVEGTSYHFDWSKTGARSGSRRLLGSRGARFVYYRTGSSGPDRMTFFGSGLVDAIHRVGLELGKPPEFVVRLSHYRRFSRLVPKADLPNLVLPHAISEISAGDFDEIVRRGNEEKQPMTIEELVDKTGLSEDDLRKYLDIIEQRNLMLVFEGPPGTSKTYLADLLVRHLAQGDATRSKIVQFHASYAYEEFVEGIRPAIDSVTQLLTFKPVKGVVMRMAEQVETTGLHHYLIVDEMNRANLPRVFGELLMLLEYRDKTITMQYSDHEQPKGDSSGRSADWRLPEGLKFIGTMNTADRSIRSIDAALRRRMFVVACAPRPELLRHFYSRPGRKTEIPIDKLVAGMELLNQDLGKKEMGLGPEYQIGHTFFMPDSGELTWSGLRDTWEGQIFPLIKEYLFDRPEDFAGFTLDKYWSAV